MDSVGNLLCVHIHFVLFAVFDLCHYSVFEVISLGYIPKGICTGSGRYLHSAIAKDFAKQAAGDSNILDLLNGEPISLVLINPVLP